MSVRQRRNNMRCLRRNRCAPSPCSGRLVTFHSPTTRFTSGKRPRRRLHRCRACITAAGGVAEMHTTSALCCSTRSTISLTRAVTETACTRHPRHLQQLAPASFRRSHPPRRERAGRECKALTSRSDQRDWNLRLPRLCPCCSSLDCNSCWRSPSSSIVSFRLWKMNLCLPSSSSPRCQCVSAMASAGMSTVS